MLQVPQDVLFQWSSWTTGGRIRRGRNFGQLRYRNAWNRSLFRRQRFQVSLGFAWFCIFWRCEDITINIQLNSPLDPIFLKKHSLSWQWFEFTKLGSTAVPAYSSFGEAYEKRVAKFKRKSFPWPKGSSEQSTGRVKRRSPFQNSRSYEAGYVQIFFGLSKSRCDSDRNGLKDI